MAVRSSSAEWKGALKEGSGTMTLGSGACEVRYTYGSRFESAAGSNPDELVGAALAGCFSMFLAALLTKAGTPPTSIRTGAKVHLMEGPVITVIELDCEGDVPNVTEAVFKETADAAKKACPVSKALAGPEITLTARLRS